MLSNVVSKTLKSVKPNHFDYLVFALNLKIKDILHRWQYKHEQEIYFYN